MNSQNAYSKLMRSFILILGLLVVGGCGTNTENQALTSNFTPGCHTTNQKYAGCCLTHGGPDKSCTTEGQFNFDANAFLICKDGNLATDCLYTP